MANKAPKFEIAKPPVRKRGEEGFMEWCNMVVEVSFDAYKNLQKQKDAGREVAKRINGGKPV